MYVMKVKIAMAANTCCYQCKIKHSLTNNKTWIRWCCNCPVGFNITGDENRPKQCKHCQKEYIAYSDLPKVSCNVDMRV